MKYVIQSLSTFFGKIQAHLARSAVWIIRVLSGYLRKQKMHTFVWERLADLEEGEKYRLVERLPVNPFLPDRPMLLIAEQSLLGPWVLYDTWGAEVRLVMMKTSEYDSVSSVSRPNEGDTIMRQRDKYVKTDSSKLFS